MFAGSCIGVILLVILLEFLRRLPKEYDRFLVSREGLRRRHLALLHHQGVYGDDINVQNGSSVYLARFTPTMIEQAVRALLHMLQFAVAYFVMLTEKQKTNASQEPTVFCG